MCGMISQVDEAVGRLRTAFEKRAMWTSTLLFFLSDNGGATRHGSSNGDLRGEKGSYWEGGVRAPGVVNGGYLPPAARGTSVTGLLHLCDWCATS